MHECYMIESQANFMSMELCEYGSLFDLIERTGGIKDDKLVNYLFLQVCDGLKAVHEKAQYAHLDLKLENILIGSDFKLKLCDFGSA